MSVMTEHAIPTSVESLLTQIRPLLDAGHAKEAFDVLTRSSMNGPIMDNARGVCLLRLGQIEHATNLFRSLIFPHGSPCMDDTQPAVFKTNYVTAMLMSGNIVAAESILCQIHDRHPSVARLRDAIRKWKRSMGLMRRLAAVLSGAYPDRPVEMDFPPGDL